MRIHGLGLRHKITIEPATGNTGDGDTFGTPVSNVPAQVKTKVVVSHDANGQAMSTWATCRIRPTVRLTITTPVEGEDPIITRRPVAAGDRVTVNGVKRLLASVEPVRGPGTAIAYYELVAGNG